MNIALKPNTQVQTFKPSETICSKVNVRSASKAKQIEILASDIEHHGQLQPVIIRYEDGKPAVIAGQRRRKALLKLEKDNQDIVLEGLVVEVDDMEAIAISLSENKNQLPMTAMDSYKAFSKLAKQGWQVDSIAKVYSMKPLQVRQTLALGELPASVIKAYEEDDIDDDCLKLLAVASKGKLNQWIKLYREDNAPTWASTLRNFLNDNQETILTEVALFDVIEAEITLFEDIFEETTSFADVEQFWALQNAEIDKIKTEYEDKRWVIEVVQSRFSRWEYTDTTKKDGGKVYIFVSRSGGVEVKQGLLTNSEFRALERRKAGESVEGEEQTKSVERPEVSKKLQEYCLGYLTQAARSTISQDYDLTQRVLLVMLLTNDGTFSSTYSDTYARIDGDITESQLFATDKHTETQTFQKEALKKVGVSVKRTVYQSDFKRVFKKVMNLDIEDVQAAIQAHLIAQITPHSEAVQAIHKHVKPDMTGFWNAEASPAFVKITQGKPLLFSILASLSDSDTVAQFEKAKVVDIKEAIQQNAVATQNWLPAYFTGGHYGNGVGAPLK